MKWGEMRWPEMKVVDRSKVVAIIPIGSMEQHGPHLPLEVDAHVVSRLAEDLEKEMPEVMLLPPVWTGVSAHHMDFPGTVTLRPRVFIDLVRDICTSLLHHGFSRIVLLNGHGGNRSSLEVLGQELYSEIGLSINVIVYWDLVPDLVKSMKKSSSKGMGHSGELETSLMLYLAPHLVSRKDIPEGLPRAKEDGEKGLSLTGRVKRYVNIKEYSEIGVDGNPGAASLEDGERFYRSVLVELHKVVGDLRALPN